MNFKSDKRNRHFLKVELVLLHLQSDAKSGIIEKLISVPPFVLTLDDFERL